MFLKYNTVNINSEYMYKAYVYLFVQLIIKVQKSNIASLSVAFSHKFWNPSKQQTEFIHQAVIIKLITVFKVDIWH